MLLLPFIALATLHRHEVSCVTFKRPHIDLQYECMRKLLGLHEYNNETRCLMEWKLIWQRASAGDPCSWSGVSCRKTKKMGQLEWKNFYSLPELDFLWFPNTLTSICIERQRSTGIVCMRMLPQELMELTLEECGLTCTVDLTVLPPRLRLLKLRNNEICGTLYLNELPKVIELIDMRGNKLSVAIVTNGKLPPKLQKAELTKKKPRVQVICTDAETVSEKIAY